MIMGGGEAAAAEKRLRTSAAACLQNASNSSTCVRWQVG
jgi:hypothetical protein